MLYPLTHPNLLFSGGIHGWLILFVELALLALAIYVLPSVAYSLAMLLSAAVHKRQSSHCTSSGAGESARNRFCVLIPAHNESLVIESTLASVAVIDYPADLVQCVVIADNCTDNTAVLARAALPSAQVLERTNSEERGKGYALNWALQQLLPTRSFDAVVIIDADTQIAPNFLSAMDRELRACGEADRFVAQGLYQVHNVDENWRTSLMAGALSLVHYVRPMARERWGTSVGLKGNGMCFAAPIFEAVSWRGDSITEDIDYGLDLIEHSDIRVRFVPDAVVRAQMPTDEKTAQGQRRRWEGGRSRIVKRRALPMLRHGLLRGDRLRIDAALDLCCPPLAQLGAAIGVWGAMLVAAWLLSAPWTATWLALWAAGLAGLIAYVVAGFGVSGAPRAAYRALGMAVVYVPWKIVIMVTNKAGGSWNRTERRSMNGVDDKPAGVAGETDASGRLNAAGELK